MKHPSDAIQHDTTVDLKEATRVLCWDNSLIALAIRVLQEVKDLDIHDDDASLIITHHHSQVLSPGPSIEPDHTPAQRWARTGAI